MADQQLEAPDTAPALTPDVVRHVFAVGDLELEDRLRAQAVCQTWRAALAGLPVRSLELYVATGEDKWEWAIQTRPEVEEVQIYADPYNLAPALLHSVAHKALRVLWLWSGELDVRSILPCPADFPHLRTLYLKLVDKNTGWLSCLQHAPQLEQLQLMLQEQPAGPPPPAGSVVLPPMPKLAQLAIYCDTSSIGVRIPLDGLPALRELALDGGSPTLCADPSASSHHVQLTQLTAKVSGLRLEGARALSGLRHLTLDGKSILVDEALHTATALTRLELGSSRDGDHQPWMDPLLCSAWSLASLRALVLHGPLIPELAAELRGFSQLRALVVDGRSYIGLLLSAAHLWTNLEALSWDVIDGSPVIATLCEFSRLARLDESSRLVMLKKLERLHLLLKHLSAADIEGLAALPALRHLWISGLEDEDMDSALAAVRAGLPWLASVSMVAPRVDAFLEAAPGGAE